MFSPRRPAFLTDWDGASDAWLICEGRVCASLEIAGTAGQRRRGLRGRDTFDGAFLLPNTRSIHSFGVRFAFDAAVCTADLVIIDILNVRNRCVTRPRFGGVHIIEAPAGAFDHWDLDKGDRLEVRF